MRSSRAFRFPICVGEIGATVPLKPQAAFPLHAAFPRSEYYAALRLLPALPPPFGLT